MPGLQWSLYSSSILDQTEREMGVILKAQSKLHVPFVTG